MKEGYLIAIFSNQKGLGGSDCTEREIFQSKIRDMASKLSSTKLTLLAAMKHNVLRKPSTGMWDHFVAKVLGKDVAIDVKSSFYVGDAAGRPKGWRSGASKDFASTDRKFAINTGLRFFTPEEFFLGHPEAAFDLGFNPKALGTATSEAESLARPGAKEAVLFVGSPASGKSTAYRRHFQPHGYEWVNQDQLKTRARCLATLRSALASGRPAVIGTVPEGCIVLI